MKTTSDRILLRMQDLKLQHKDLVAATGASKGTVTNWISGVNEPTGKRLIALASALQTSPNWLLTGKNEDGGNAKLTNIAIEVYEDGDPIPDGYVPIDYYEDVL
jgi:transcriptional regulator with XRE-family HTH domain